MASFVEDHLGMLSFVVNRRTATAQPTIIGVSGNTEDASNVVIRSVNLSAPVVLSTADQQKLADLMTLLEGLLKTQEDVVP